MFQHTQEDLEQKGKSNESNQTAYMAEKKRNMLYNFIYKKNLAFPPTIAPMSIPINHYTSVRVLAQWP